MENGERHQTDLEFESCQVYSDFIDDAILFGIWKAEKVGPAPFPPEPRLVSSVYGEIEEIAISIPPNALNPGLTRDNYKRVLSIWPDTTTVVLLFRPDQKELCQQLARDAGILERSLFAPAKVDDDGTGFPPGPWTQDPFLVSNSLQNATPGDVISKYIEPKCHRPTLDIRYRNVADSLAAVSDQIKMKMINAVFQGGNTLVAGGHIIMGGDEIHRNAILYELGFDPNDYTKNEKVVADHLSENLASSQRYLFVRSDTLPPVRQTRTFRRNGRCWDEYPIGRRNKINVQPLFHIDLFLTLAGRDSQGRETVLVGDPELAAELACLDRPPELECLSRSLDEIAARFRCWSFTVIRNPLPVIYFEEEGNPDDDVYPYKQWYVASSNNAIVQVEKSKKFVWLPRFGFGNWSKLKKTDDANKSIWCGLNFEVQDAGDFHLWAKRWGGLHCMAKITRRSA